MGTLAEPAKLNTNGRGADTTGVRPGLAIVSNSITPYRVNLHRLIAAGIPELQLHSLITHGVDEFDWHVNAPPEIHVANFSMPGDNPRHGYLHRPWGELQKGSRLIEFVRQNNVRSVIFNGYNYISYQKLAMYCRSHAIPFFLRSDSNIRSERPLSFLKRVIKRAVYSWWMTRVQGVMPMGALGDQFFLKYGANADRLYRVPCWPDYDAFANVEPEALARFRRKFGLEEGRHYFLFSGRLAPEKRVDLLIDAFAAIATERPLWNLLIAGNGSLHADLARRVPEHLKSRVIWAGFLEASELVAAYHSCDVLVLPSELEPWALVVQEAMAAGLVVVSSDVVGAAYELIQDGKSGRVFPSGQLLALKNAILDVTADNSLAQFKQHSRAALATWRTTANPVAEIRRALTDASVLTATAQ
ncbi:MAG: glycosyltransferase family 4 protein [Pirellulales bacterium]|nr:glycosyltransferase family 4 protein [Pirellulales bacterium]